MRTDIRPLAIVILLLALCAPGMSGLRAANDDAVHIDRQEGYHYPTVGTEEDFTRHLIPDAPPSDGDLRERFVSLVTRAQLDAPETPRYVVFAKGSDSRHLIIVALDDNIFRTIFRARAVLAQLSSNLRESPLFVERGLDTTATFFDMLQILDFESLTVTDGVEWSHKIHFR
ncbi:MAG: hypothetical protein ACJAVR_002381 [Paracoccaceae bacterium]|jgi:hypothetical protein